MSDTSDVLIHIMEENWAQARQSEDQRAAVTGLGVVIASALQGGLTQTGFTVKALPLTITLIILGSFGMMACAKLYERFSFHIERARKLRTRLDELHPDAHIQELLNVANKVHKRNFPFLERKVRLHVIWLALNGLIAILGIIYTVIIIVNH